MPMCPSVPVLLSHTDTDTHPGVVFLSNLSLEHLPLLFLSFSPHTHTHIYIYMCIHACACLCARTSITALHCFCVRFFFSPFPSSCPRARLCIFRAFCSSPLCNSAFSVSISRRAAKHARQGSEEGGAAREGCVSIQEARCRVAVHGPPEELRDRPRCALRARPVSLHAVADVRDDAAQEARAAAPPEGAAGAEPVHQGVGPHEPQRGAEADQEVRAGDPQGSPRAPAQGRRGEEEGPEEDGVDAGSSGGCDWSAGGDARDREEAGSHGCDREQRGPRGACAVDAKPVPREQDPVRHCEGHGAPG
ncbi:hypothetical protein GH5_06486 [Leishmania sp. Ghana 2012 LV757]|uniref:hypothetical protein n=1 Tax=Leishmania sp. Ghana 2012 LV757 TaxID=2803181 RepID=UPI001B77325C|nr:hypothetical protein GH5_06486 [Leishmania sp. Ghana 2012 LV757]